MMNSSLPFLSVVIIGRNEGDRLRRCLDSLRQIQYPADRVEIIYVDSGSRDGSPELAQAAGAKVSVLRTARPCAAKARNMGWRIARYPYVLFLDGDTVLHPGFPTTAIGLFDQPGVAVVAGRRHETNPGQSIYTAVLDLDWFRPDAQALYCGGDALFDRAVLEETGGFDDELIAGEEPELCWRIRAKGRKIAVIDVPMTGHDLAITSWRQYWQRCVRTGHAYAEVAARFRDTHDPLWSKERDRNQIQSVVYLLALAGGLAGSLLARSKWPLGLVAFQFAFLLIRTAYKNRRRTSDPKLLLAYAAHSHLQHIPMLAGQLTFWAHRIRGRRRSLIEYQCGVPQEEGRKS
jgi:hypothetical protein